MARITVALLISHNGFVDLFVWFALVNVLALKF